MQYIDFIIENYHWQGAALAAAILLFWGIQLYYYLIVYRRVSTFLNSRRKKKLSSEPPVSVIVPLFSEDYTYLEEKLPALLAQQYSSTFEIVLVYVGRNTDFYDELIQQRLRYPNLMVTKIEFNPRFPISVKMALNVGIKSAQNEHIIITTTSAMPASENWLATMGKGFKRGDIVLGYTALEPAAGLSNYLMRLSRLQTSIYWLSAAVARRTYKGSRNNFGFTKSLYFSVKGFTHLNMNIGEEDLFLQRVAKRNNVSVVLIPKATMIEHPWGGMKWWIAQLRHFGSAYKLYPLRARNGVEWELTSQVMFFITALVALIFMPLEFKLAVLLLILLRYAFALWRIYSIAKRVGEKGVALKYFIFDLFNPLLMLCVGVMMLRKDSTVWR